MGPPELDYNDAVGAAIVVGGYASLRLRLWRYAPTIVPLEPAFEAVVDERREGSISRLGLALAAVWAAIVICWVAVVGPVVVVEKEGRRCGEQRVGESEEWKKDEP